MTISESKPWFSKVDKSWLTGRSRAAALTTLLALTLALLLLWPLFRRVAIARCPANSIEIGRTPANEPTCVPRQP